MGDVVFSVIHPTRRHLLAVLVLAVFAAGAASGASFVRRPDPISITAPASAPAGTTVCVTVWAAAGAPAVRVEQGHDVLKVTSRSTEDGVIYCFDIPPGTPGIDVVVTAVDGDGNVATKTIRVT